MSNIYVNGIIKNIENIFEMVSNKQWYQVTSIDVGRDKNIILKEWIDNHKTYYYIKGNKVKFELK